MSPIVRRQTTRKGRQGVLRDRKAGMIAIRWPGREAMDIGWTRNTPARGSRTGA
ncbi:hypothetical protein D779_3525 [Imhoffiella purpurea]|uniref:Uncharacterized protein n=1 Tax=Imhoffiella purpurea TaxID=1249627 RepID=W9V2A9_9GAMM|nr:hypothetical protein D779_3525 [Imhoffiella purpurea]